MELISSHLINVINRKNDFFKKQIKKTLGNAKRKGYHTFCNLFNDERNELLVLVALPDLY